MKDSYAINLALATVNTDEPFYTVEVSEDEIIMHPEYDHNTNTNDIAVIELKKALKLGSKIGKIDMVNNNFQAKSGTDVTILGFSESNNPNRSKIDTQLRYVNSKIEDFKVCQSRYLHLEKKNEQRLLDEKRQFCTTVQGARRYLGGIEFFFNKLIYVIHVSHILCNFAGAVITKDKKMIGIISRSKKNLPEIATFTSAHREFINGLRVM